MSDNLENHLRKLGKEKAVINLRELKKLFPKEKATIDRYAFIGIIEKDVMTGMYKSKIA